MDPQITGLIPAPHTPFTQSGDLAVNVVSQQAELFSRQGLRAVFIGGTTGEGHSLSVSERKSLAEAWITARDQFGIRVMIHAGSNCVRDAQELAAHAAEIEADAVAAMSPFFFKPTTVAQLVDFCQIVAAAAPRVPFYLYELPALTGVRLPMDDFLAEASQRIPNLAGIKYTSDDLLRFQKCLAFEGGRYNILFGFDEILLSGLALGAKGGVGSSYNFAAPLYQKIIAAFDAGELESAKKLQRQSAEMIQLLAGYGYLRAAKSVMGMLGVDCGPVRPPLTPLTEDEIATIREALTRIGFFDWGATPTDAGVELPKPHMNMKSAASARE
jgi:N-acetylneuraminate lyase